MTATAWIVAIVGGLITFSERFVFLAIARRTANVSPQVREALRLILPQPWQHWQRPPSSGPAPTGGWIC